MRLGAIASAVAIVVCVAVFGVILIQKASLPVPAPAPQATRPGGRSPGSVVTLTDSAPERSPMPAAQASPMPAAMASSCSNPDALGVSRVVEIDTTAGPGLRFQHFKAHDFLPQRPISPPFTHRPCPN